MISIIKHTDKDKMKPTKSILILLSLFLTFSFSEDLRVEIIKRYFNGNKKLLVKYKGEGVDEVIIERITYSKSGDTLILENTLDKMKMVKEYYRNGQIEREKNYKDGKLDGKYTLYYYNGEIKSEKNFKDGKKDGKWTLYHENGQRRSEENYIDGRGDGKYTYYYENGQIRGEENYKDGKWDGKWTYYYENGQIKEEGNLKKGWWKKDGKWTTYNEDGSIKKVEEYKDGELVQ
jgi:antitoxin component YwqK of YwqJK toxin-antitoxin module